MGDIRFSKPTGSDHELAQFFQRSVFLDINPMDLGLEGVPV